MPSFMVYVGTYTEPIPRTESIFAYRLDAITGDLALVGTVNDIVNPSYLSISADRRFLLAVNEVSEFKGQMGGGLSAFAIDSESRLLEPLNAQCTGGAFPCYVNIDTEAKLAFVATYGGGSLSVFSLSEDGRLDVPCQIIHHHGASINVGRQKTPHVHSVVPDPQSRYLLVADLGTDSVSTYRLDRANIMTPLVKVHEVSVEAGSGPRHLSFHPSNRFLYLVNELSCTVTAFAYDQIEGSLRILQNISTLPEDFAGINFCGDIHVAPSGMHLYVSNRGHDSIAIFAIDETSGHLTTLEFTPTQGKTPRNFAFDPTGSWLVVANQDSDSLVTYKVDQASGQLMSTGQITTIAKPACVKIVA